MRLRPLPAVVLLSVAATGQTFIVDANNGPGTHFLDIASATAAVPDRATLVRGARYGGFSVVAKGLSVLGEPNVVVTGGVDVRNTTSRQPVELRNLVFEAAPSSTTSMLVLDNCAGLLLLDRLTLPGVPSCAGPPPFWCLRDPAVNAVNCQQLLLRGSSIAGNVAVRSSQAVIDGCMLSGEIAVIVFTTGGSWSVKGLARTALSLENGVVQSTNSAIAGGPDVNLGLGWFVPGAPAVDMSNADLRLLRGQVTAATHSLFGPPPPAITASGACRLRADPSVQIFSLALPPVQGTPTIVVGMPSLTATDGSLGGTIDAGATAPAGDLVILLIGYPGPVSSVAGITDAFWLEPAAYLFHAFGVPPPGQPLTGSVPVPNQPHLLGLRIAWQAVSSATATGLQASNPGISELR